MSLTVDSIVWINSGGVATTSTSTAITVTAAGGYTTDPENTVIVMFTGSDTAFNVATPLGWSQLGQAMPHYTYARGEWQGLGAGESSWNFTPTAVGGGGPAMWVAVEIANVETGEVGTIDQIGHGTGTGGSTAIAATGQTSSYDSMYLVALSAYQNASGTPATWSALTADAIEVATPSYSTGTKSFGMVVAVRGGITGLSASQVIQATQSGTFTATDIGGRIAVLLNAKGARREPQIFDIDGAEHGLITGNTLGVSGMKILETVTAGVSVSAAAARSGGYGWLLSSTSAACNFTKGILTGNVWPPPHRRHFRFPTLPGVDTPMWTFTTSGGTALTLRYITASQTLGFKFGSGTEVVSDQTITANQWFGVDLNIDLRLGTGKVSWQVDYDAELDDKFAGVEQSAATSSFSGALTATGYRVGWTTAITAAMHTDDAACGQAYAHYPLGDIRVLPVKVDPAGTPTISGTSTNFGVMTADGTVAAWDATVARDAVDDVPPDLAASRDAAVCLAAHATDYMEFPTGPMPDLAATGVNIRGVKGLGSFWADSTAPATIRLSAYDGVVTHELFPEADPDADDTATPVWFAHMLRSAVFTSRIFWNQTRLDALAWRVGSNDATPDIGVDTLLLEVAVRQASAEVLFGEPGSIYIEAHRDPDTNGLIGFTVNTPADQPVTVDYEVDGVPYTTGLIAGGSSQYVPITADSTLATVNRITLKPG